MSDVPPTQSDQASPLATVRNVIAVGAGKGGVGKSTAAVLLAAGLKRLGWTVALLDGDVYGPSLPKLTGTETAQPDIDENGLIIPPTANGLSIMSIGHMVPPEEAVIWRGPMAQRYVKEFLDRGRWGELDCLIVDLPPGTGDIPLTLAQSIPLTGSVVVCTPQDVALLDAIKALRMYEKLGVDSLGLIENMSHYICPSCGNRDDIFGHGGVKAAAKELGVPFLGGIPINIGLRKSGDAGTLLEAIDDADTEVQETIVEICKNLAAQIEQKRKKSTALPQLRVSG